MTEMNVAAEPISRQCPQCQNTIPVDRRYVTWCERCGWNVNPLQDKKKLSAFEKVYTSLGKHSGDGLFHELEGKPLHRKRFTVSKVLGYVAASVVHAWTLLWLCLGLFALIGLRNSVLALLPAAFFLGLFWFTRPRLGKLPKDIARRDQCPVLYGLADRIADQLKTSRVDGIVLTPHFNASMAHLTLRRRKIIFLGLPLFTILSPQERVALLAHEVAHSVNGDPARGLFIGGAISTLADWYQLTAPDGEAFHPVTLFMFVVSRIPWLGFYVLSHLLWRDLQRAEYLADHLAVRIGGTSAAAAMIDKLHLKDVYANAIRRVTLNVNLDFFCEMKQGVADLAPRELERIRRMEQLEGSRLDLTHPPTAFRLTMLQAHPADFPEIVCGQGESEQIDRECAAAHERIQKQIAGTYIDSLMSDK